MSSNGNILVLGSGSRSSEAGQDARTSSQGGEGAPRRGRAKEAEPRAARRAHAKGAVVAIHEPVAGGTGLARTGARFAADSGAQAAGAADREPVAGGVSLARTGARVAAGSGAQAVGAAAGHASSADAGRVTDRVAAASVSSTVDTSEADARAAAREEARAKRAAARERAKRGESAGQDAKRGSAKGASLFSAFGAKVVGVLVGEGSGADDAARGAGADAASARGNRAAEARTARGSRDRAASASAKDRTASASAGERVAAAAGAGAEGVLGWFGNHKKLAIALVAVLALVIAVYPPACSLYSAARSNAILSDKLTEATTTADSLQSEVDSLMTREGIEDEARRRGYVSEGETAVDMSGVEDTGSAQSDTTVTSGASDDAEEDPWYIQALDFIFAYDPSTQGLGK